MGSSVVFEPGFALIAGTHIPIRDAGTHGEIQMGDADGLILRPLTYGERSRVVMRMAGSSNGVDAVCSAILRAATVQPGEADRAAAEILALVLAGADADAPPFATTLLTVASAVGWSMSEIDEASADEIDRLAIQLGATAESADDGWSRIVFIEDMQTLTLEGVRRDLAERLIARAGVVPNVAAPIQTEVDADDIHARSGKRLSRLTLTNANFAPSAHNEDWHGVPDLASASPTLTPPRTSTTGAAQDAGEFTDDPGSKNDVTRQRPSGVREIEGEAVTPDLRLVGQNSTESPRPRFRLLSSHHLQSEASAPTHDPAPEPPINRVTYQPYASAAQGRARTSPVTNASFGQRSVPPSIAPALEIVGTARNRTDNPLITSATAASVIVSETNMTAWNETSAERRADMPRPETASTEVLPMLSQIETLVGDEVADALAALLDHEADLRGIDR